MMADERKAAHEHPWKVSDVVIFPLLFVGSAMAWAVPLPLFDPASSWVAARWVPGGVLLLGGFAMIRWAKQSLKKGGQPSLPGQPTTELLTTGAFALSRNPNYLGTVMALLSAGVLFNSFWLCGTAILTVLVLQEWMIKPEEAYLAAHFPAPYASYCADVRRWL